MINNFDYCKDFYFHNQIKMYYIYEYTYAFFKCVYISKLMAKWKNFV